MWADYITLALYCNTQTLAWTKNNRIISALIAIEINNNEIENSGNLIEKLFKFKNIKKLLKVRGLSKTSQTSTLVIHFPRDIILLYKIHNSEFLVIIEIFKT